MTHLLPAAVLMLALHTASPATTPEPPGAREKTRVTLEFRGPLGEGLRELADEANLNLVVTDELPQQVELYLHDASGEQALNSIATAHGLQLRKEGELTIVSKASTVPGTSVPDRANDSPPSGAPSSRSRSSDIVRFFDDVHVAEGTHARSAAVLFGTLEVDGELHGDAFVIGGKVRLGPRAIIHGDVAAFSGTIERAPTARVDGEVSSVSIADLRKKDQPAVESEPPPKSGLAKAASFFLRYALLFVLASAMWMFFPLSLQQISAAASRRPLQALLLGAAAAVGVTGVLVMLIVSLVGIPLVPFALFFLFSAALAGVAAVARVLGARLTFSDPNHNHIFNLALGLLIISGLTALPYVGWLILLILLPLGLGAPILAWLGRFGAAR